MKKFQNLIFLSILLLIYNCEKEKMNTLSVSVEKLEYPEEGGIMSFTIETDADSWYIENPASEWLFLSKISGTQKEALISASIKSKTIAPRADTLIIIAGNANPAQIIVTQTASDYLYNLSTNRIYASFHNQTASVSMVVVSDAPQWYLSTGADWIQFSQDSGKAGSTTVYINVSANPNIYERSATVILSAEYAPTTEIPVSQKAAFPSYNTNPVDPDITGMSSIAAQIADKIKLGLNIGNTLEAMGGETSWGNPKITESFIKFVKQCGINAIRLPCSWNQYADQNTAEIKPSWLNRVKEVVQYCVDNDMYVILNIHWDGGWLEENCIPSAQNSNNAKQKAFWEQIATKLRDFDEHLMFASANEPNVKDAAQMGVLMSYHQTFINAVRSTGGKNAYRVLVVQGPNTDIETTNKLMTKMPADSVPNRLMAEIHYYTPWNFTGMQKDESWGNMFYYWGKDYHSITDPAHNPTWGEEETVNEYMALMKSQFVVKGIPVVLGEYGCELRTNLQGDVLTLHKASRAYYIKYVTQQAKANGLLPFFWDVGGMLDRNNNTVLDQQALEALLQGAAE
jgi:aryl-phospho-beta-D-glucosidase BglC (GH1 family)